jgi:hypothetical protein
MPNECLNNFKLVGKKETLDEIVKSEFSFSYFLPSPENASIDWYAENWSTNKESFDVKFERTSEDTLYISCITAWSVPINFLKNLIKKFPELYVFNQYCIEFTDCGIVILYMFENEIKEKEFKWFDPVGMDYVKGVYNGGGWC